MSFLSSLGISADRVWEPGDAPTVLWREHDTAVTLQRSLLPRATPEEAGLQIAYRYQPANRSAEAGGDWFDVIPLQDGQVALVIGDVTGHNIRATAIMGQFRMATAVLARTGRTPQEIMRQLSRLLANFDLEAGATCLYALYDPRTGEPASPALATRHPRSVIPMAGRSSSMCPRARS